MIIDRSPQIFAMASLAMDLKRMAMFINRGSWKNAERFKEEALKRWEEIDEKKLKPYIKKYYNQLPEILNQKDKKEIAEDALMYSTIFQNYAIHNK